MLGGEDKDGPEPTPPALHEIGEDPDGRAATPPIDHELGEDPDGRAATPPTDHALDEDPGGRAPTPPALHELEAEVMEELWKQGEASVRSVMEALNPRAPRQRAYTTYMTIMARLFKKGVLARRREGKTDFYAPKLSREQFMAARARTEVDQLVAQYGDVALSHFARQVASLDPERRRALERLARKS
jgi:predicted transcriptional regulator